MTATTSASVMTMRVAEGSAVVVDPVRRGRLVPLVIGMAAGTAMTAFFMRRQLLALAARAAPYVRRRSRISNPALIINRWSGDGKAEQFGLADAARERVEASRAVVDEIVAAGDDTATTVLPSAGRGFPPSSNLSTPLRNRANRFSFTTPHSYRTRRTTRPSGC